MKIAICDDAKEYLNKMDSSLRSYLAEKNIHNYEIDKYDNPSLFLDCLEKHVSYDIVFLDICMPGISGIAVAHEIRNRGDKTEIVFVTTSDEFAVDAFALKAVHYIIKSYKAKDFEEAVDRAFSVFLSDEPKRLSVKTAKGDIRLINIAEIVYIESMAHSQGIHTKCGDYTEMRRSLYRISEELEKLSPGQFISPIKGYVINLKEVADIQSKHINMRSGAKIPHSFVFILLAL